MLGYPNPTRSFIPGGCARGRGSKLASFIPFAYASGETVKAGQGGKRSCRRPAIRRACLRAGVLHWPLATACLLVIPAKAGTHFDFLTGWKITMGPGFRRGDGWAVWYVIAGN